MDKLTDILDRVSDENESERLMPSSRSYRWSQELMQELAKSSTDIFKQPREELDCVLKEIEELRLGMDVIFVRALKQAMANNPSLDEKHLASIIVEKLSGEVFTDESQLVCSQVMNASRWEY